MKDKRIIDMIISSGTARIAEIDSEIFKNKIYRELDKKINIDRNQMYIDANQMSPEAFFKKYRPITLKVKCKKMVKNLLYKTGLYNLAKKIVK